MKKRDGLSTPLRLFYGIGDCAFTLMSSVESYFFNFFLTNLAQFNLGIVTTITTIFSLVDACLSWIYGAILNSIKPKKWGRYRSWLILIPWVVPFLYAFQFFSLSNSIGSAVIITLGAILSHVAWNFPYVANVSMINVAGKTPDERIKLSSSRALWANLSKVVFAYVGPPLATVFAGVVGETNQYAAVAFVLGCVMAVAYFGHFKMFEGYEQIEDVQETGEKKKVESRTSAGDLVRALFQNPPLLFLIIADLAKWMFNFVCMGFAVYYFTYVAKDAGLLATYMVISNIACVVGSFLSNYIAKKFSTRTTTIVTFMGMAIVMLIANFTYLNVTLVIVLMSLAQLGYGIAYACTPALYADTIVYSEWKTGKNATGWVMGLQNVPLKVGVLTRGIIINACLALAAFSADIDPTAATTQLMRGICVGFMVIPAVALIIGAVLLLFGFKITRDKVTEYQKEIDSRNAKTA